MNELVYTTNEVAEILSVSVITVQRWIKTGKLPGFKIGKRLYVDIEDFQTWMRKKKHPGMVFTLDSPESGPTSETLAFLDGDKGKTREEIENGRTDA